MTDPRFYSRLRLTCTEWFPAEFAGPLNAVLAPADLAVLIGRAVMSPEVPAQTKAYLIFAGLYTSAGVDALPEAILGPVGYLDDSVLVLEALHRLLNQTDRQVIESLWPGDMAILHTVQGWVFEARDGVQRYVVRPFVRWLRQAIGSAVAGRATHPC